MSELHAATALASFADLEARLDERNRLAAAYTAALSAVPGIGFPDVPVGDRSTYKDFTILIDPAAYGRRACDLAAILEGEGIESRRYYAPPVHAMQAYRGCALPEDGLPVTDRIADRVLTLPLWVGMTDAQLHAVARAIGRHAA